MEYRIVHGIREEKVEEEMNMLAKEGFELIQFISTRVDGGFGNRDGQYCHAIMARKS